MGNKSCEEYTTMFNRYALLAGYNSEFLIRKYMAGLNKALQQKVIGTYPFLVGLGQWKERGLELDKEFSKINQLNRLDSSRLCVKSIYIVGEIQLCGTR